LNEPIPDQVFFKEATNTEEIPDTSRWNAARKIGEVVRAMKMQWNKQPQLEDMPFRVGAVFRSIVRANKWCKQTGMPLVDGTEASCIGGNDTRNKNGSDRTKQKQAIDYQQCFCPMSSNPEDFGLHAVNQQHEKMLLPEEHQPYLTKFYATRGQKPVALSR
jgi:hypothetical protein